MRATVSGKDTEDSPLDTSASVLLESELSGSLELASLVPLVSS